jgi:hypothetical protein
VSFKRIKNIFRNYKPKFNLINGGKELVSYFKKISFSKKDFNGIKTNRLKKIKDLINKKYINNDLFFEK